MTAIGILFVLALVGTALTVFVAAKCHAGFECNSLTRQEVNLLWWSTQGMMILWIVVFFAVVYCIGQTM